MTIDCVGVQVLVHLVLLRDPMLNYLLPRPKGFRPSLPRACTCPQENASTPVFSIETGKMEEDSIHLLVANGDRLGLRAQDTNIISSSATARRIGCASVLDSGKMTSAHKSFQKDWQNCCRCREVEIGASRTISTALHQLSKVSRATLAQSPRITPFFTSLPINMPSPPRVQSPIG